MDDSTFRLPVTDGVQLHVHRWLPASAPRAIVQIAHGMAEHGARYGRFAQALCSAGFGAYAQDHRGHGLTAPSEAARGYFGEHDGWARVVSDMRALNREIAERHPDVPIVMMGHSMGSFLLQDYLITFPDCGAAAVVLSGSNLAQPTLARVGRALAQVERARVGEHHSSDVLQAALVGNYNKRIAQRRTEFDWLSRDDAEVDKYIADPLCGFPFSTQAWLDLMGGLLRIGTRSNIERVPTGVPYYLFAGDGCPVGGYGKGVRKLAETYRSVGVRDLEVKLYPGGRHEMLNELNRDQVTGDLIDWLDRKLPKEHAGAA